MKELYDNLSFQVSKQVTNQYSTSFSSAVKMLSPSIQGAIHGIYGFVRLADEIVDSFHGYDKERLLNKLEVDLDLALDKKISLNPILQTFQEVVHQYNIDKDLIDAFMKSMRADLYKTDYNTMEEYNEYIYGSADVVGLMCLKIFVNGDQVAYDKLKYSAMKLGSAFQKVNFLRDMKDDQEVLNRSYFPQLSLSQLNENSLEKIVAEIQGDFEEAMVGIKQLPLEARFGVYTAYIYYRRLLVKIEHSTLEDLRTKRIRVSNPVKMYLLAKSFFNYKLDLL